MKIHDTQIRRIMRYAVASASSRADGQGSELEAIHMVKYVYLADLAWAEAHGGTTLTGLPWRFDHFGPWAREAAEQVEPAMALPAIRCRPPCGPEDVSRWSVEDPALAKRLERELPAVVRRAVGSAVRELGNDTSSLLHHIYRTLPMLRAAPGEVLDFSTVVADSHEPPFEEAPENQQPAMTEEARSERQAAVEAARARVRQALAKKIRARAASVKPDPPRYDEVFAEIQEWLDGLAGEPIEPLAGELIVSDAIWKSPVRSQPSIP